MPFKEWTEFAAGPLELPYRGKVYVIAQPDVETGAKITSGLGDKGALREADNETLWRLLLGPAFDEMKADRVPQAFVSRAFMVALTDFQIGREVAEVTWEVGSNPEAIRRRLEELHPAPVPTASIDTAGESATP